MTTGQIKTFDFTISRTIRGSANEIFDVWLDPKSPGGLWFGVERVIANPVVDGLFYHAVKHEGRSWPHYGRFIRLDRGRVIEHTWMSEATRGLESIVTITLASQGDSHRGDPAPCQRAGRRHGQEPQGGMDLVPHCAGGADGKAGGALSIGVRR